MERHGRDLEPEAHQNEQDRHRSHDVPEQSYGDVRDGAQHFVDGRDPRASGQSIEEAQPEEKERRGDGPVDEVFQAPLGRPAFVLLEGGEEVEADRHCLQRKEEREQLFRRCQEHHADCRPEEECEIFPPVLSERPGSREPDDQGKHPGQDQVEGVCEKVRGDRAEEDMGVRIGDVVDTGKIKPGILNRVTTLRRVACEQFCDIEPYDESIHRREHAEEHAAQRISTEHPLTLRRRLASERTQVDQQEHQAPDSEYDLGGKHKDVMEVDGRRGGRHRIVASRAFLPVASVLSLCRAESNRTNQPESVSYRSTSAACHRR